MAANTEMSRLDSLPTATLNKLIALAESGALPAVTSEDNGDVLTVVSGAWAKAAPSGGGGEFIIHYDPDDAEDPVTESYEDILAAVVAGKTLVVHRDTSAGSCVYNTSWDYWPEADGIVQIHAHELIPGSEDDEYWITFNGVNIRLSAEDESVSATPYGLFFAAEAD